jgi:hypothetical protein
MARDENAPKDWPADYHERFLMRFQGGPVHGDRYTSDAKATWPLPDEFPCANPPGAYVKTVMSQLPPMGPDDNVIRGVTYEFRTAEEVKEK